MEAGTSGRASGIRRDAVVALGLLVGFLCVYLRTLCPTVYLGDAGEICSAIATGGVVHPPGYPLFSLLGRIALVLVPYGEPAFRIGCLVALAAAAAVAALYFLARELGCSPWASATAATVFGAGYTFWNQSTRVEVYSLHVLLAAAALLGGLRYRRTGRTRDLAAAALAVSLGLAHHLTIVLVGPALLVLCGPRVCKDPGLGRRALIAGALLAVGPALYLLLMLWAQTGSLHAWGRPVTLSLLWDHASARFYQGNLHLPDGAHLLRGLSRTATLFADNFPYLIFLLPVLGVWSMWQRSRLSACALLLAVLTAVAYNLCYSIDDIAPYYLSTWLVAAVFLAAALDTLRGRVPVLGRAAIPAGLVSLVLLGLPIVRNWGACDLSRATWVREFARNKLENTDPGGVLISQLDPDTFPIWYVQDVLNVRPDVVSLDRAMFTGSWSNYDRDASLWYLHHLCGKGIRVPVQAPPVEASWEQKADDQRLIELLDGELRGRPLCMTYATTDPRQVQDRQAFLRWARDHHELLPQGIILRLQSKSQPVDLGLLVRRNERLWNHMRLPDLRGVRTDQDLDSDYVVQHYACMLVNFGGLNEMAGDRAGAAANYRRALALSPDYRPAASALASLRQAARTQSRLP